MLHCLILQRLANAIFFFFNDTATTEIYTLSLHDALPISPASKRCSGRAAICGRILARLVACLEAFLTQGRPFYIFMRPLWTRDRKSTRLNSSHSQISYAVFCLKKKTDHCRRVLTH